MNVSTFVLIVTLLAFAFVRVVGICVNCSRVGFSARSAISAAVKWLLADTARGLGMLPIFCVGFALWKWTAFAWLIALISLPVSAGLQWAFIALLRLLVRLLDAAPCRELLQEILE